MKKTVWLSCCGLVVLLAHGCLFCEKPPDRYKVLPAEGDFRDQSTALMKHLARQPQERSWQREVELARIRSEADWEAYRKKLLAGYRTSLGLPYPERTPLEVQTIRVLDRGAYRVEVILYQSMPEVYVTANLYVPQQGDPPYPGILFPCGHSANGKAYELYHGAALGLVQKGYVVLVYDPPGQGERYQYLQADGTGYLSSTTEHSLLAYPLFLMDKHLMAVRTWEGMRGIDYLLTRPEVDPERIGCTGNSGGGTVTLHLVPLEPRIKVAVPVGTVGTPELELGHGSCGDGEQNLPRCVPFGISHADLMMLAWPRPYRLIKESQGEVRRGTRASFVQAQFLYRTLGAPERMTYVETEEPHGYFRAMREPMYYWFGKWFYGRADDSREPELHLENEEDLLCSASGQILNEKGIAIWQWAARELEKILPSRPVPRTDGQWASFKDSLAVRIGELLNNPEPGYTPRGRILDRMEIPPAGVEKIVLYTEEDIYLPCLYFKPREKLKKAPLVLLADSRGKTADGGLLAESLAARGVGVFAVDLRGTGELELEEKNARDKAGDYRGQVLGVEACTAVDGMKLGRPIFAMRVYDLLKTVEYLVASGTADDNGIALAGRSSCGPPALYAAALDSRIRGVVLDSALVSFSELVNSKYHKYNFIDFLPRVLADHDLPQVAGSLAPRPLWLLNSLDAMKQQKDRQLVEQDYQWARDSYREQKAGKKFRVGAYSAVKDRIQLYQDWVDSFR
ncbi:MAG: acetylxylan esterase [Candidatus Glassbacteria bacterium]|nr:acetylxylan esterase [Candidatus Glassbacteria bacterium]